MPLCGDDRKDVKCLRRFGRLWITLALFGGLVVIGAKAYAQKQLSPAEYEACIVRENIEFVRNCYRETLADDMTKSRAELPVMSSPEDRVKNCRANLGIAKSIEKYYPDAQSVCGKKPP